MGLVSAAQAFMPGGVVVAGTSMGLIPAVAEDLVLRVEEETAVVSGAVCLGAIPE
jgi:ABC-type iron transport system FetAB permease component